MATISQGFIRKPDLFSKHPLFITLTLWRDPPSKEREFHINPKKVKNSRERERRAGG